MAEMIPDRMPSGASAGEKKLFAALQNLPDDCLVYYEAVIKDRQPDFIVIMPDLGVLVIEVKGWWPAWIKAADSNAVVISQAGAETSKENPIRQARNYMFRLKDACEAHRGAVRLMQQTGAHANSIIFPFGHACALSNIARSHLAGMGEDMAAVFPEGRTLARDELEALAALGAEDLKARLRRFFDPWWQFPSLSKPQIDILRAVINPIELPQKAGADIALLDAAQEKAALGIGEGHRIIYGVAGSGKTVILLARAKNLARDPGQRILMLCYNKPLAAYLRAAMRDYPGVAVKHFHQWGGAQGVSFLKDGDAYGRNLLQILESGGGEAGLYDAVLVDEFQDFSPPWFTCAKLALKEPEDGDLLIVGDASQSLYGLRGVRWKECGIRAQGRSTPLRRNYRNTAEILSAAHSFAAELTGDGEGGSPSAPRVAPQDAQRNGPWPIIKSFANQGAECDFAIQLIEGWLTGGVDINGETIKPEPGAIGVLYPRIEPRHEAVMAAFREKLHRVTPSVMLAGNRADGDPLSPAIKISSIQSAKGLQFRFVIMLWADLLPSSFNERDEAAERGQIYVAMTRAEDVLVILHSGPSRYIGEAQRNLEAMRAALAEANRSAEKKRD